MNEALLVALGSVIGALITGLPAMLKARSERRSTDANAELMLQHAAAEAVQTVQGAARHAVESARADADYAEAKAAAAHREVREAQAELIQMKEDFAAFRAEVAAERAALERDHQREMAERDAVIQAQRAEIGDLRVSLRMMEEKVGD